MVSELVEYLLMGGLNNKLYKAFNDELNRIKNNYAAITPIISGLDINQLHDFLKCIEYFSDQTITPSVFFLCQYYDYEVNLHGGVRKIKPLILYMYNFNRQLWNIIGMGLSTLESNYMNRTLHEFNHNFLSGDDLDKTKDVLMNYISKIKY
ncbi:hypothetical protein I4U23_010560 [Adineta vaga]|nr:hypothetical protein I4U23_010560 [Adineta vaga]